MNDALLPLEFSGYARKHGRPGIRNHLVILSVCGLNAPGARKVKLALPDAVLISTGFGRGQAGKDKLFHDSMLMGFGCHPNTGAAVVLAADQKMREHYQSVIEESGRPCAAFSLQECEEDTELLVTSAIDAGTRLLRLLAKQPRQLCPVASLAIAVECGHSDASSGIVANPLAGDMADQLISSGGVVVISETMEWTGTEPELYRRCESSKVASRLEQLVLARHALAQRGGINVQHGNPGPQNHDGGITTLEEKSRGAIAKGGTHPIAGALEQGETLPARSGLYLMDTPSLSPESISSMVAAGAQLLIFTTGHGNPYGSAMAPTLKLTANPVTASRLPRQIDIDASTVFTGQCQRESVLPGFAKTLIGVCEGQSTFVEILDEGDEVISRLSASL